MIRSNLRQELAGDAIIFVVVLTVTLVIHLILGTRLSAGGLIRIASAGVLMLAIYKVVRVEMFTPKYILIGTLGNIISLFILLVFKIAND